MGAGSRLEAGRPVGDFPYYSSKNSEWLRPNDRFIDGKKQKEMGTYFENCGKISLSVAYERKQRIKENFMIFDLSGKIKWPLTVNLRKNQFERK